MVHTTAQEVDCDAEEICKFCVYSLFDGKITIDTLGMFCLGDGEEVPTVLLCGVEPRQLDVIFGHTRTLQMHHFTLCMALA